MRPACAYPTWLTTARLSSPKSASWPGLTVCIFIVREWSRLSQMSEQARHLYDPYATHQAVLYAALRHTGGPVIEFGCGHGSTPLLHRYCEARKRELLTLDTDSGWIELFSAYQTRWHTLRHVGDWATILTAQRI